jgi:hypothetical protein
MTILVTIVFSRFWLSFANAVMASLPNHVQSSILAFLSDQAESLRIRRFPAELTHLPDPLRDFPLL